VTELPATFTRAQVVGAFDALGLDDPDDLIAGLQISATEVDVELYVPADDGRILQMLGECATVTVTIPVDEDG
jgi:hypothetical protein